jgi:RNA polymerase sigma-70 factor (ECF subfamily)
MDAAEPLSSPEDGVELANHVEQDFDLFFATQHPRLFSMLCLTTGDRHEADEIAQEAFLRVWERWHRVSVMQEPAGYLYAIAMNVFRKRYRRAKLASRIQIGAHDADDIYDEIDQRETLSVALRALTPQQRAAVILTTMLGFRSEEAGRMLGIKDSTVRVLANRARAHLRTTVEDTR